MRVSEIRVKRIRVNQGLSVLTVQILTNDVQVLILCLSYFITTLCFEDKICIVNF